MAQKETFVHQTEKKTLTQSFEKQFEVKKSEVLCKKSAAFLVTARSGSAGLFSQRQEVVTAPEVEWLNASHRREPHTNCSAAWFRCLWRLWVLKFWTIIQLYFNLKVVSSWKQAQFVQSLLRWQVRVRSQQTDQPISCLSGLQTPLRQMLNTPHTSTPDFYLQVQTSWFWCKTCFRKWLEPKQTTNKQ